MRRALGILAAVVAVSAWTNSGRAQTVNSGFSDPFFLYFGYYLPQQAALANQPRIQDTLNANVAAQQAYAQTNRANLYDPNGGYGRFDPHASVDPFDPNSRAAQGARVAGGMALRSRSSVPTANTNGNGPPMYFNRTAQFYPSMRSGRGPNANVRVPGRGVRTGGVGMPGPR